MMDPHSHLLVGSYHILGGSRRIAVDSRYRRTIGSSCCRRHSRYVTYNDVNSDPLHSTDAYHSLIPLLSISESREVLSCTNLGTPVITLGEEKPVSGALNDMVDRFLGEERELRFVTAEPVSFFRRFFG